MPVAVSSCNVFLSTLSLRRATQQAQRVRLKLLISIHALLAESDDGKLTEYSTTDISIHALLAESDIYGFPILLRCRNFYPRSPCGERR